MCKYIMFNSICTLPYYHYDYNYYFDANCASFHGLVEQKWWSGIYRLSTAVF